MAYRQIDVQVMGIATECRKHGCRVGGQQITAQMQHVIADSQWRCTH